MKAISILILYLLIGQSAPAQRVILDRGHFNIVNENAAVRLAAENTHNSYLKNINNRLSDINLNLSSVVAVQNLILNSLREVDQGLKTAIAVKQIGTLVSEIVHENSQMIEMAKSEPHLLIFAENLAIQMKNRSFNLFTEVSNLILKEGDNILMDFEKRDALLKKISLELKVIRALVFSMKKSMYFAKMNGIFRSLNPYQNFINQDLRLARDIISKSKLMQP